MVFGCCCGWFIILLLVGVNVEKVMRGELATFRIIIVLLVLKLLLLSSDYHLFGMPMYDLKISPPPPGPSD